MGFFGGGGGASPANMGGATSSSAGTAGLVPAPAAGDEDKQLFGDAGFSYGIHLPRLKSINSRFVAPFGVDQAASTSTYANKIRHFTLFYFPVDGTINRISIFQGSGVTQNAHFAMWKYNPTDGTVGDLIYDIGTVSLNSANNIAKDFAVAQSVKRGLYFFSFTADGTTGAIRRMSSYSGSWMAGASLGDFVNTQIQWYCDLGAGGTYNQTTNTTLVYGASPAGPIYMYIRYA
jgi:hypothetical protein